MTKDEFLKKVISFLASPEDIVCDRQKVIITFNNSVVELTLKRINDELYCIENDKKEKAQDWIINRLAKLDILANAILDKISNNKYFIDVPCKISSLENENDKVVDTIDTLVSLIDDQEHNHDFTTNVFYLTAEAGEGKTCILNQLARIQAKKYKENKSSWLLLIIPLGGRPFLRLDEIIIGTLSNYYRFNSYYIESCIELIKQGRIVLALDGFEEMFISGEEGNVISSLGNLFERLDSYGKIIFSTRKAYFQYANLEDQAKLYNSFQNCDIEFSILSLEKWEEKQFCDFMKKYKFDEEKSKRSYNTLSNALSVNHPILTRAVLASKLIEEIALSSGNIDKIIEKFRNSEDSDIVTHFIDMLLEREVTKWVSADQLKTSLLSKEQHVKLLTSIADEMWHLNSELLKKDTLMTITELVCSDEKLKPEHVAQCKERIIHHALISPLGKNNNFTNYSFCHEDFYHYFLGKMISTVIIESKNLNQIRNILDKKTLPEFSIREAARVLVTNNNIKESIKKLQNLTENVIINSCLSLNLSSLLIRIFSYMANTKYELYNVYCSSSSLFKIKISNIKFQNCIIEKIEFDSSLLNNISFYDCEINEAVIPLNKNKCSIYINNKSFPAKLKIYKNENDFYYEYDPNKIEQYCNIICLNNNKQQNSDITEIKEDNDEELILFNKLISYLMKNTAINENVIKVKMGSKWSFFESNVLSMVMESNILAETEYKGKKQQSRYKLNCKLDIIIQAQKECHGKFNSFLSIVKKYTNN